MPGRRSARFAVQSLLILLLAGCVPAAGAREQPPVPLQFSLREVSREVGIQFRHEKPRFDPKLDNLMPWLTTLGASVAAGDYDGDGCVDLYVTTSSRGGLNELYRNQCDGTFAPAGQAAGVADVNQDGASMGAVWADYDNDGCTDLFVYRWGRSRLFHNLCNGAFADVTEAAGVGRFGYPGDAIALDYNLDGCLDYYVGNYFRPETNLWDTPTTRVMHNDFERARNGGPNWLFQGRCDGTFTDVAPELGLDDTGWALSVAAADLTGAGWPSIYIANDFGPDVLFLNEAGRFRRVVSPRGVGDDTYKGMNIDFADVFGDGRMHGYVSNITRPGYILEGNQLWQNLGGGQFEDVATRVGLQDCGFSWGARWVDLENSGRVGLVVMNGFVSAGQDDYWYDLGIVATTPGQVVEDAAQWPPFGDKSLSGYERECVFVNRGDGTFVDVAAHVGVESTYDGRGVAAVDLDNNGTMDLVMAHQGAPVLVYRNSNLSGNHWLLVRLQGRQPSNRDAVGARIRVRAGGRTQTAERDGGNSFAGQSDPRVHFGLGQAAVIEELEVRWPSGQVQRLVNSPADQVLELTEPAA